VTPPGAGAGKAGVPYGTAYWVGPGKKAVENMEGDDSRIIMDRAIPFIERAVARKQPFLAVIWFHAPHLPVVAGPRHRRLYADRDEAEQHYFGCLSAMDEQVGRLRSALERLGAAGNTMLWFASDNGPEGAAGKAPGSAGPLRGRKRSLYEGGIRVPGLLVWPQRVTAPRTVSVPCSTADYYPTVLAALGMTATGQPLPLDGIDLLPLIDGRMTARPRPIGFQSRGQSALIEDRYKLYRAKPGRAFELYDLTADPGETNDLARQKPETVARMRDILLAWQASCAASDEGKDY
jgi:arylsulfatase A-like enzyme